MSGALAWQVKKYNKKVWLVFERDRTGFLPGIFSRVVSALLSFLISIVSICLTRYNVSTRNGLIGGFLTLHNQSHIEVLLSNHISRYYYPQFQSNQFVDMDFCPVKVQQVK